MYAHILQNEILALCVQINTRPNTRTGGLPGHVNLRVSCQRLHIHPQRCLLAVNSRRWWRSKNKRTTCCWPVNAGCFRVLKRLTTNAQVADGLQILQLAEVETNFSMEFLQELV